MPKPVHAMHIARQAGDSLIEVLVALVLLSVGLLGVAAFEAASLSTNSSAYVRGMATIASYSILDAMRSDPRGTEDGSYNGTVSASACPAVDNTRSLARQQLSQWCASLGRTLNTRQGTQGSIACRTGICTVTIQFDKSTGNAHVSVTQRFTTQVRL